MMMRQFEVTAGCGDGVVSAPAETCDSAEHLPDELRRQERLHEGRAVG